MKAMYAVTDGFSGLNGDWDTPGTGMNFLVHNMCRLPGSDGTWMIVKGGMGTVTATLAAAARAAGREIETGHAVQRDRRRVRSRLALERRHARSAPEPSWSTPTRSGCAI